MRIIFLNCLLLFFVICPSRAQDSSLVRTLKLTFVGDIMGHGGQIKSAQVDSSELYDYSPCFEYVTPILKEADLAIGNLEVTLPGGPPYTGYPTFKSPDDLALALRHAGFDLLVTANNHSNDAGILGVTHTIKALAGYGFYQTGTFADSMHRTFSYPLVVYKNNFKLAFLNYTYDTNGIPTRPPTMVNEIDNQLIKSDLKEAVALQPDFIVVFMHWGKEYQLDESEAQQDLADSLFNWGADLVVGAHPHVVQPIKTRKVLSRDSVWKNTLTAYSLGNFISSQRKRNTDLGIVLEVELTKSPVSGRVELTDHAYIPVYRYIERPPGSKQVYRVIPVSLFEGEQPIKRLPTSEKNAMIAVANRIRAHLDQYGGRERKLKPSSSVRKEPSIGHAQ